MTLHIKKLTLNLWTYSSNSNKHFGFLIIQEHKECDDI